MTAPKSTAAKKNIEILIIKQPSLAVSVAEDIFTFGGAILVMWFNHAALSGNGWIDFIFILIVFMTVAHIQTKRQHRFDTRSAAMNYLKSRDF